uniref:NADH dehydrogenase subunit 6 n=1 Tax=Pachyphlegyas modiglianii TaxID=2816051 RepID=A0A8T9ZXG7_9HEMI|nr:NADH dehydrogenase subunit 6 [Pachyphlegyas modiglianii]
MLMKLLILLTILSFILIFLSHPLSITMLIILQTLIISITTNLISNAHWFSYIIVISMLSGMMVLFMYMSNVASNEKFKSSISLLAMSIIMMPIMSFLLKPYPQMYYNKMMIENEINSLMQMFNYNMLMIMGMIIYLILTMIIISYIVNIQEGPLRTKK